MIDGNEREMSVIERGRNIALSPSLTTEGKRTSWSRVINSLFGHLSPIILHEKHFQS